MLAMGSHSLVEQLSVGSEMHSLVTRASGHANSLEILSTNQLHNSPTSHIASLDAEAKLSEVEAKKQDDTFAHGDRRWLAHGEDMSFRPYEQHRAN